MLISNVGDLWWAGENDPSGWRLAAMIFNRGRSGQGRFGLAAGRGPAAAS